jgi:hypothetical protein
VRGSLADKKKGCASVIGSLSGVTGAIDMDISYKDYPVIIRKKGLNHLTVPAPVPEPVPVPVKKVPPVTYQDGDKAKVINTTVINGEMRCKTYTGGTFRVYNKIYDVIGNQKGDRVVIGIGNAVTAAVNAKNLERVI